MAFLPVAPTDRTTKPKRVIFRNCLTGAYAQPDGTWGRYKTAKRFDDDARAKAFAAQYGLVYDAIYPVSKPKAIKK